MRSSGWHDGMRDQYVNDLSNAVVDTWSRMEQGSVRATGRPYASIILFMATGVLATQDRPAPDLL